MKKLSIIFWCWLWFALANVADVLTSLQIWGGEEENPYFRDADKHFMTWHSIVGKGTFFLIMAVASLFAYRLIKPLNENVAKIFACALPIYYAWGIWQVADNNLFWILHWVHP